MDGMRNFTGQNFQEGRVRSSLGISVDAAPFTPRSSAAAICTMQLIPPARPKSYALSADAPEFYPRNFVARVRSQPESTTYVTTDPVFELRHSINVLTQNPAEFHEVMSPLVHVLSSSILNEHALVAVVEELFVQAMKEANFRYTGARACSFLSDNLKFSWGGSFQQHLINRCLWEDQQLLQTDTIDSLTHLIEFTLFMGELLLNVKSTDTGQVIPQFPEQIVALLFRLLACKTDATLRCVVQVLKLTGAILEECVTNLNDVFAEIELCAQDPTTQRNIRAMLVSVIDLRANNWGQTDTAVILNGHGDMRPARLAAAIHQPSNRILTEPVYYNCNGQPFCFDETELCEDFGGLANWTGSDDGHVAGGTTRGSDYWVGDHEMDSETAAAYEQFMAETILAAPPGPPIGYNSDWSYHP